MKQIRKAAVLGSGVMGAAIAGHLANVGIPTLLLDIVPKDLTEQEQQAGQTLKDQVVRNRFAIMGKNRLLKEKPSPLYEPNVIERIEVGNLEDDLTRIQEVDWVIEVVVENLEIKKELFAKVEQYWKPGIIVTSNTSGISLHEMVKERSKEFRKHFFGTHFFNPPRYLPLLEVIPTKWTDPTLILFMKAFAERVLGKGVVLAKDTPNFIANRIGTYGLQVTLKAMEELGLGPDEVDSVTGKAMGRPKSATFRTLDLVGLDTYVHVTKNVAEQAKDEEDRVYFQVPSLLQKMLEKGWLGAKSGQGFYLKKKSAKGTEILVLDPQTMEYRERKNLDAPSLSLSKRAKTLSEGLKLLLYADDVAGKLAWTITKKVLLYSAKRLEEIADSIQSIDEAMRWGFNWELGPFEMWDAIGVAESVAKMKAEGEEIPSWIEEMLASGKSSFYQLENGVRKQFHITGKYKALNEPKEKISLAQLKEQGKLIRGNKGASLIDLGDGIACLEFHSLKQAIGSDVIQMIQLAVKEVEANYRGLVIGNQAPNFCVGANLMLMLMEAQDQNWVELDWMVRQFQQTMGSLRTLNRPVVAAPFQMTLGGGVEVCLPADRIQASAETYMGLVEVGVGLIPGGGGTKEMLLRMIKRQGAEGGSYQPIVNQIFETIAKAKVSTSGADARKLGFLRPEDGITTNPDFLLYDAKQVAIQLAELGYRSPLPQKIPVVGEAGYNVLRFAAYDFLQSGFISEHDYKIACKLAYVLSGGDVPEGTLVEEQYLLDLEREAFLSLIGEPKTQQRMQYMLAKGKPLRN